MNIQEKEQDKRLFPGIWVIVIGLAAVLCISSYHMFKFDMISEYMVDLQELADGNLIGHITEENSIYKTISTVPEDVYNDLFRKQGGKYHFDHITDAEKQVYVEILWTLTTFSDNVEVSTLDNIEISKCFQCVLNDHPEIFYVKGYHYSNHFTANKLSKITIYGSYTMDQDESERYRARIDACVDQILADIPDDADEYKKAKYVYEYIINHTEYDAEADNNQNILSVLLNGKSVCQGYSKSVQYLLQRIGMQATTILGYVEGGRHSWNLVSVNGQWYYIDATWGDSSYYIYAAEDGAASAGVNYDYLLVTTKDLERTHFIDTVVDLPICTSITDNYYVKEGLYFDALDTASIKAAFEHGYESGWEMVTLKCASPVVYEQMKMYLINNQKVFQYINSDDDMIPYIDNASNNSISFWL